MASRFLNSLKINDAYTLPSSDGSNGQVIVTDGSGNLAFADPSTSSSASVIYRDNFTGDGSTVAFTLQNSLSDEDQTFIYIDGVYQEKGTYSLSTNTITFTTAPDTGHSIEVISVSGINVGPTTIYQDNFTGDGTTTDFTLAQSIDNEVKTMIYFNGVYQFKGTYSLNNTTISFDTAPANGVDIEVISIASAAAADYNQKVLFYGKANEAISKGDAIMLGGQEGDHFLLSKATQTAIAANHEYFLGLASQDLAQGEFGYVTEFGKITELDTSGYTAGDILWFDAGGSTAGALTTTEPAAPLAKIQVAAVIRSHQNEGVLFIRPTWYHELGELHDVNVTSVADKDMLVWDNANGYWENSKSLGDITTGYINYRSVASVPSESAFVYSPADEFLAFGTGGSERMRIDDGGYVGIGTTSPSAKLHVNGTFKSAGIQDAANANAIFINGNEEVGIGTTSPIAKLHVNGNTRIQNGYVQIVNSSNPSLYINNAVIQWQNYIPSGTNNLSFKDGISDVLVLGYNGGNSYFNNTNVGIGTTSPGTKLHIEESSAPTIRFNATAAAGGAGSVQFYNQGTQKFNLTTIANSNDFALYNNGGTNSFNFYVKHADGNVGIATNSPSAKLDVNGNINISATSNPSFTFASNDSAIINRTGAGSGLYFQKAGSTQMLLDSSGNLGIGTTSPSAKLHIQHNNSTVALTYGTSVANNPLHTAFYSTWSGIGMDQTTAGIRIAGDYLSANNPLVDIGYYTNGNVSHANWNSRMRINQNGNVGIGTTSPAYKLQVNGDMRVTSNVRLGTDLNTSVTIGQAQNSQPTSSDTKLVLSGKNLEAGGTYYGDYGQLLFNATSNYTGSARKWLITNGLDAYKFSIIMGGTSQVTPTIGTAGGASNGTPVLTITDAPNVGIGTISPRAKFEVSGDIYQSWADAWRFVGQVYQDGGNYRNGIATNSATRTTQIEARSLGADGEITFFVGTSEVARMIHGGNVGIGTTTPYAKLAVNGASDLNGVIKYRKVYGSINTTGNVVARLIQAGNGASAFVKFECYGGGGYQRIVYNCINSGGNWSCTKQIDEGANALDVTVTSGIAPEFTFKGRTNSQGYSPSVSIEGTALDPVYYP